MTKAAVIAIVRLVIDTLVQLLFEEAKLFKNVHREIRSLADELARKYAF